MAPKPKKNTRSQDRLLTPEPTPGVEEGRIQADAQKAKDVGRQESREEIERILKCPDGSHAAILAVESSSSQDERLAAWRLLGCKVHPHHCKQKKAQAAFTRLQEAAETLGVDQPFIDEVVLWDGEADLGADDDATSAGEEEDDPMDEDQVPLPPAQVEAWYKEATLLLHELEEDPDDTAVLNELRGFNAKIKERNETENAKTNNELDHVPVDQWMIPLEFFRPHYQIVQQQYAVLEDKPDNKAAKERIATEKRLVDEFIEKHHFPPSWGIKSPESQRRRSRYPWVTGEMEDGSVIIGVRRQGKGTQVCVERVGKDGHAIRTLESASAVGSLKVEQYQGMEGHKNLAEGQREWSSKDREDFVELRWATDSRTQRHNAGGKRNPPADCCVEFRDKGLQILTVSNLRRVLGVARANAEIKRVCIRDGICPPWEARGLTHDYPAAVEEGPTTRGQHSPATSPSSSLSSAIEAQDSKIERLEATVASLANTVDSLGQMFREFMKASSISKEASSS